MATEKEISERRKEVSGQVSAQTRAPALGLLAISWALLTAHDEPLKAMAMHPNRNAILAMSFVAASILAFDLLQYVAYTNVADKALKKAEQSVSREALYDEDWVYRAAGWLYHAKFYLLTAGALLLLYVMITMAFSL